MCIICLTYSGEELCGSNGRSHIASQETEGGHIMLSYQWDDQATMIKLRNGLRNHGYKVWLDIDCMGGSTLQAMAEAVENAAVVLISASHKYKDSPNCRAGQCCYSLSLSLSISLSLSLSLALSLSLSHSHSLSLTLSLYTVHRNCGDIYCGLLRKFYGINGKTSSFL
jgi:hypothetical protein